MTRFRLGSVALLISAGFAVADEKSKTAPLSEPPSAVRPVAPGAAAPAKAEPTHQVTASIAVKGTGKPGAPSSLQTICLNVDGKVVALVAPPKPFGGPVKGATAELHLFAADGKFVKSWTVDFHVHAINCGPDGAIYAAGDGKLARFDKDGKQVGKTVELPYVADLLKDKEGLRKKAEAQIKRNQESYGKAIENAKKQFAEKLKELEAKKPTERTKTEVRQIEQYKRLIEQYDKMGTTFPRQTVDQVLEQTTGRVRVANGVAVSEKDVFVVSGEIGSYGYAVWRLNHDLKDAKQVLSGIGGCCGQMDVQCHGTNLLVAENTKHQFARYDRDGKKLGSHGKRGVDNDPACFGGCCNPMNLRASGVGDVYTAESEGIIKRFSPSGEFLETAAAVKLTGGCKNVALAVSPDAKYLYFCDQPNGKFHILEKKAK